MSIDVQPVDQPQTPERRQHRRRYLMSRPDHFTVSYRINPWMEPAKPTNTARAVEQWQRLYDAYVALGHEVHLTDARPENPAEQVAGFLVVVDDPDTVLADVPGDSRLLAEEKILAVPGRGFGMPNYIRLAFCVDERVIAGSAEGFKRAMAAARK